MLAELSLVKNARLTFALVTCGSSQNPSCDVGRYPMAEPTTRHSAPRILQAPASLFPTDAQGDDWHEQLNSADKETAVAKIIANCIHGEEDNNQDDNGPQSSEDQDTEGLSTESHSRVDTDSGGNEIHRLRTVNTTLAQRVAWMETQHAQHIGDLEAKLQHAIETHKNIEQRLRTQLRAVLREQQEAVENARKVRGVLNRVSTWMRQVQRAAHTQRPSLHVPTPVNHDGELRVSPHSTAPYTLWAGGTNLATNVQECPTSPNKFPVPQDPISETFEIQVNNISETTESVPPPAPGRNRSKGVPGKGFNYVGYTAPSPSNKPAEVILKPLGVHTIVLDDSASVNVAPRKDTPVPKRGAGHLLAYCAQVVTTSLSGMRSFPSPPQTKVTPAWKLDHLCPVQEETEVDEEAGQCSPELANRVQRNVALPNLSLGLL